MIPKGTLVAVLEITTEFCWLTQTISEPEMGSHGMQVFCMGVDGPVHLSYIRIVKLDAVGVNPSNN